MKATTFIVCLLVFLELLCQLCQFEVKPKAFLFYMLFENFSVLRQPVKQEALAEVVAQGL